jgi:hypothetical protein
MPAKSKAQQRLMQIAEHAPDKLYAKNRGVAKMTHQQLHDFSVGSEKSKPEHVKRSKAKSSPKPSGSRYDTLYRS